MKLLTDSKEFACDFFNVNLEFSLINSNSKYSPFFEGEYFETNIDLKNNQYFDILILNKYSHTSQFDLLAKTENISENIICLSDSGNDFHGFKDRKWETLSGNLHISLNLRPNIHFEYIYQSFVILAANTVLKTIQSLSDTNAGIKWVNDIIIDDSKIAGIITKTKTEGNKISDAILGIGINIEKSPELKPDKFIKKATHLNKFGYNYSAKDIFYELLKHFNTFYSFLLNTEYDKLFDYYDKNSLLKNQKVRIYEDDKNDKLLAEGKIEKINNDLTLKIENVKNVITKGRISTEIF